MNFGLNFGFLKAPPKTIASLQFSPGAFASGTTVGGIAITCSRAGTSYYRDVNGAWQAATNNQFRVGYTTNGLYGLMVEPAMTNLYPTPAAPAAGSATLGSTGTFTFWVEGTGSQQISAGTATCAGLPATASAGKPVIFTCSVNGTVNFAAVTGSLTIAQLEKASGPTSYHPTARVADAITFAVPASFNINSFGLYAKTINEAPWNAMVGGANSGVVSLGQYNAANSVTLWFASNGTPSCSVKDASTLTTASFAPANNAIMYAGHDVAVVSKGGTFSYYLDGVLRDTKTRALAAAPTTAYLGVVAGAYDAVYVNDVFITANPVFRDRGRAVPQVGMLGDSITYGYMSGGAGYPDRIGTSIIGRYNFLNYGVTGETLVQQKARYDTWKSACSVLTLMGGINDIRVDGTDGATTWARARDIIDDALGLGMKVVVMTTLPRKGEAYIPWTADQQTAQDAYNASIMAYNPGANYLAVDMWSVFVDGANPNQMLPALDQGDHLHPSTAGQALIASTLFGTAGFRAFLP